MDVQTIGLTILVVGGVTAFFSYLSFRQKKSSWVGVVIDKRHEKAQEDDDSSSPERFKVVAKTENGKKVTADVFEKEYNAFEIGDKIEKKAGEYFPTKIIAILCLSLILAGCTKKVTEKTVPQNQPAPVDTVFSTIKEAITKSIVIVCDYTDPEDKSEMKIYFKGQTIAFRAGENNIKEKDFAGLIKDNQVYIWDTVKNEGMLIDLNKATEVDDISIAGMSVRSNEDVINALEPHRKNCKPTADLSVFDLPQNVKFE